MNGLGKHGGVGRLRALERKSKAGRGEWRKNKSMHSNTCYILRHNYKIKIRNLYTFLCFYYTYFENMGLIFPNIVLYLSIREYTVIDLNQMEFGTFCTQWKTLGFGTAYLMLTFI